MLVYAKDYNNVDTSQAGGQPVQNYTTAVLLPSGVAPSPTGIYEWELGSGVL